MRDRLEELRKYGKEPGLRILEIGAFFNPIFPKSSGFNSKVLDAFSKEELLKIAKGATTEPGYAGALKLSESQVAAIEDVDFIWSNNLSESVAKSSSSSSQFDLVCSSHNFEHQPNPLKFLQDIESLLSDDGICTMAIPISTRCRDLLRFPSSTRDFIEKFEQDRTRPGLAEYLDSVLCSVEPSWGQLHAHKTISHKALTMSPAINGYGPHTVEKSQAMLKERYVDTHVSVLNPKGFILILVDLLNLGYLKNLKIFDISEYGIEFFVHLSKSRSPIRDYDLSRKDLCVRAADYWATEIKNAFSPNKSLLGRKKLLKKIETD